MRLDELPLRSRATIAAIEWPLLSDSDAKKMRNLGFDEGVAVEAMHHGPVGRDPMAVRIGRMTVAIRRAHARAVRLETAHAG